MVAAQHCPVLLHYQTVLDGTVEVISRSSTVQYCIFVRCADTLQYYAVLMSTFPRGISSIPPSTSHHLPVQLFSWRCLIYYTGQYRPV